MLKNNKSIIISPSGDELEVAPLNNKKFTLDQLQDIVGGNVQLVKLNNRRVMVCNEEGIILDLPINDKATELLPAYLINNCMFGIRGTVLVCERKLI